MKKIFDKSVSDFLIEYENYIDIISKYVGNINKIEINISGGSDRKYYYIYGNKNIVTFVDYSTIKNEINNYINVSNYLGSINVNIPKVYLYDKQIVMLEYLGTDTIFLLYTLKAEKFNKYLFQVLNTLSDYQIRSCEKILNNNYLMKRKFGFDELLSEWQYFKEMYLIYYKNIEKKIVKQYENYYTTAAEKIINIPYTFMHRDFQSQNFHIKTEKIYLIDFQTAYYGPFMYDVVSFIEDPYLNLSQNVKNNLIENYFKKINNTILWNDDYNKFIDLYNLTAVFRLSQATAAYVKLGMKKKKKQFLKYIDVAVENLKSRIKI